MKRKALAAAAPVLLLAGCGWEGTGTVEATYYTPSYVSYIPVGKTMSPIFHSSCYGVAVKADDDGKTRDYCIGSDRWGAMKIGDPIRIGDGE